MSPRAPGEVRRSCLDPTRGGGAARLACAHAAGGGLERRSPAWLAPRVQLEPLPHSHEAAGGAAGQNAAGASSYSATNTALPASRERPQPAALVVLEALLGQRPVEVGSSSATCSRSFLSPIESPRACAAAARKRLKRSWSAALSGNPLSLA